MPCTPSKLPSQMGREGVPSETGQFMEPVGSSGSKSDLLALAVEAAQKRLLVIAADAYIMNIKSSMDLMDAIQKKLEARGLGHFLKVGSVRSDHPPSCASAAFPPRQHCVAFSRAAWQLLLATALEWPGSVMQCTAVVGSPPHSSQLGCCIPEQHP